MSIENSLIAVNSMVYEDRDPELVFESIKRCGIDWVELAYTHGYVKFDEKKAFSDSEAKRIVSCMKNAGLNTRAVSAHMDIGSKEAIGPFMSRLHFANQIGAKIVITNATNREKISSFLENVVFLSEQASMMNLVIALENPGDGIGSIISSGTVGAQLIAKLNLPNVLLNYDCCNAFSYNKTAIDIEADTRKAIKYSAHLHLKDMERTSDGWAFCAIGEGRIDYNGFIGAYAENEKPVPMSLELPIQMNRCSDYSMCRGKHIPSLADIEKTIIKSREFILSHF